MDVLDKFLYSVAYKFPKGYPDMENPQDKTILENEFKKIGIDLQELRRTDHYNLRKKERGETILKIVNLSQEMLGDKYQVKDVAPKIIEDIQNELSKRLLQFETKNSFPLSFTESVGYRILKPILLVNGEKYELILKVKYSKGKDEEGNIIMKDGEGTTYILSISDEALITLLLYPTMTKDDLQDKLEDAELRKKDKDMKEKVKVLTLENFEYIISLDEPAPTPNLIDANNLDYKLRTDYRKGANFNHKKYGVGTIENTSSGTRGVGDSRGMLDWVEVDFRKPYVSKGKIFKTRKIPNIYTLNSPLIDPDTI